MKYDTLRQAKAIGALSNEIILAAKEAWEVKQPSFRSTFPSEMTENVSEIIVAENEARYNELEKSILKLADQIRGVK